MQSVFSLKESLCSLCVHKEFHCVCLAQKGSYQAGEITVWVQRARAALSARLRALSSSHSKVLGH